MNYNKIAISVLVTATAVAICHADAVDDYAVGRKGEALKVTLQKHYTPIRLVEKHNVYQTIWHLNGTIDRFTGKEGDITPEQFTSGTALYPEWLRMWPGKQDSVMRDLYNLGIIKKDVAIDKGALPLGNVAEITAQGDGWAIGYAPYGENDKMECFEPPAKYKGDFARIMFYMATIYPATLWYDWGSIVFESNVYPGLREPLTSTYIKWHRDDPVDDDERTLNNRIADVQGNSNPFIDHPDIAEYLWGDKKGTGYRSDAPSDPENPDRTKVPLRGTYSLSDNYIDLYSPYVDAKAQWSLNGKNVSGSMSTHTLGTGVHELRYITPTEKGKLLITVTP